jgi:hypothetical protein
MAWSNQTDTPLPLSHALLWCSWRRCRPRLRCRALAVSGHLWPRLHRQNDRLPQHYHFAEGIELGCSIALPRNCLGPLGFGLRLCSWLLRRALASLLPVQLHHCLVVALVTGLSGSRGASSRWLQQLPLPHSLSPFAGARLHHWAGKFHLLLPSMMLYYYPMVSPLYSPNLGIRVSVLKLFSSSSLGCGSVMIYLVIS